MFRMISATAAAGLLLAACTSAGPGYVPRHTDWAGPQESSIALDAPGIELPGYHVVYRDPWQREEYARFGASTADEARAELIGTRIDHPGEPLSLAGVPALRAAARSFAYNDGAIASWGRSEAGRGIVPIDWRLYEHTSGRSCVALRGTWATVGHDPQHRPGVAAFGYYCAPPGARLDAAAARSIAESVRFRSPGEHASAPAADALAFARGDVADAEAPFGNPRFPFRFAIRYRDVDGNGGDRVGMLGTGVAAGFRGSGVGFGVGFAAGF